MADRGERRNKRKDKRDDKKGYPYKVGGRFRTENVDILEPRKVSKNKRKN
ncbi:hypothetical protein J4411_00480 [Candidatus Pacearchaeota archaeon]|nr:hypothetical protein [Candidatus Pacearchaeota archaeon]